MLHQIALSYCHSVLYGHIWSWVVRFTDSKVPGCQSQVDWGTWQGPELYWYWRGDPEWLVWQFSSSSSSQSSSKLRRTQYPPDPLPPANSLITARPQKPKNIPKSWGSSLLCTNVTILRKKEKKQWRKLIFAFECHHEIYFPTSAPNIQLSQEMFNVNFWARSRMSFQSWNFLSEENLFAAFVDSGSRLNFDEIVSP